MPTAAHTPGSAFAEGRETQMAISETVTNTPLLIGGEERESAETFAVMDPTRRLCRRVRGIGQHSGCT